MIKRFLPLIVCVVLVFVSLFVGSVMTSSGQEEVNAQQKTITKLKNDISIKAAGQQADQEDVVSSVLSKSDYDVDRKTKDDEVVTSFLADCFTWSSYKEYTKVRDTMLSKYHIKKTDKFAKAFFPEIKRKKLDAETWYNYIDDNGLNMSYKDMDSYCIDIAKDGSKYSYYTFVTVTSQTKSGAEGSTSVMLAYDMSEDHKLSNITAIILS